MNQEIQDTSAIKFAQGFYDGLGYKNSENQDVFQRAFKEGLVAIKLESLSQAEIPVIKTKINLESDSALAAEINKILEELATPTTGDNIPMSGTSYDQSTFKQVGKVEGNQVNF